MTEQLPDVIDGLWLMGDMCEGQNLFEFSTDLSETHPDFQIDAVKHVLAPIRAKVRTKKKRKNIRAVSGSKYHTGRLARMESNIVKQMKGIPRGVEYAPPWRRIERGLVLFDLAHHQSFTFRYSSMPLEREMAFMAEYAGKAQQRLPDTVIIIRGHTHKGFRVWTERGQYIEWMSISAPSFKIQDLFAQGSKIPNRMLPDNVGAFGIWIYPEKVNGSLISIVPYLYDHPQLEVEVI